MGDSEILEAIRVRDWGRLGGLLDAVDEELGEIIGRWGGLSVTTRQSIQMLAVGS